MLATRSKLFLCFLLALCFHTSSGGDAGPTIGSADDEFGEEGPGEEWPGEEGPGEVAGSSAGPMGSEEAARSEAGEKLDRPAHSALVITRQPGHQLKPGLDSLQWQCSALFTE